MWPVNGYYRCPDCLRTYRVPWSNTIYVPQAVRHPEEVRIQPDRPLVIPITRPAGKTA
jgi:hypothetical protein